MTLRLLNNDEKVLFQSDLKLNDGQIEFNSIINISNYSKLLLASPNKENLIRDFNHLNNIKGWLWERFFMDTEETDMETVLEKMNVILTKISKTYDLKLIIN